MAGLGLRFYLVWFADLHCCVLFGLPSTVAVMALKGIVLANECRTFAAALYLLCFRFVRFVSSPVWLVRLSGLACRVATLACQCQLPNFTDFSFGRQNSPGLPVHQQPITKMTHYDAHCAGCQTLLTDSARFNDIEPRRVQKVGTLC